MKVKGKAKYGYNITHIYSFIDVNNEIQLFCHSGCHKDLLTSRHVKALALLWQDGHVRGEAPKYLRREYANLLRSEGTPDDEVSSLGCRP